MTYDFRPDQQSVFVPFEVINDTIAELRESFTLFLTVSSRDSASYTLGRAPSTTVTINDDDGTAMQRIEYNIRMKNNILSITQRPLLGLNKLQ